MNKILLIIRREYMTRVKKKSFIIMTFAVPLLFIAMIGLVTWLIAKDSMGEHKKVEVVDESGMFKNELKNTDNITYVYSNDSYAAAKNDFKKSDNDYLLYIPASLKDVQLLSEKKASYVFTSAIEEQLTTRAQTYRLKQAGIDSNVLAQAQSHIDVEALQITDNGIKNANTYIADGLGLLCGFLIYMSLFIYGAQVMRGVIEEKTSRIVEVVISSVKPIQLMLGKIIGIGLVGLTQFVLWIVLTIVLSGVGGTMLFKDNMHKQVKTEQVAVHATTINAPNGSPAASMAAQTQESDTNKVLDAISNIPIAYTLTCFLFYFLFGYLLYSSLFAAVGSAVDNETETQQFMLPITMPLIFTFIISMNHIMNNPDSSLSFWLSMIPLTSPIAMMVRIPFGVPVWQLALSMSFMVLGFLLISWIAARIYRVGILMYGKKASYKELAKWFLYKE